MSDDELGALYRLGGFVNKMLESNHEKTGVLLQSAGTTTASMLKAYCARACPDEALRCMADAVTLAGGYHAFWELGSPLRSVIREAAYQDSPRMHADVARAMRLADRIEAGTVYINNYFNAATQSPVGGYKQSGYGRENGFEGMRCFMQTKSVWLSTNPRQPDPFDDAQ